MNAEDRLRAAIRAHTEATEPSATGWERVEERITMKRNRRTHYLVVPAAAAAVAAILLGVSLLGDDDTAPIAVEPAATTTTAAPTTTTTTTPVATRSAYLWPTEADRGYETPEALAKAFAVDFLGMTHPVVKAFRQNEPNAGEIDIHPNPRGSLRTVLSVQRTAPGWVISSANSPTIDLDTPADLDVITSPVKLSGRSIAYEGTVQMAVLDDGRAMTCGTPGPCPHLGQSFFTGNGTEMGPFTATLKFAQPGSAVGLLVLWTDSPEDGSLMEATVRRVRFRS